MHTFNLLHDQSPHWLNCYCFPCTSAAVQVGFNLTQYTVNEEAGQVTLTIVKLNATTREVSVLFSTADGNGMMAATGKYEFERPFFSITNDDIIGGSKSERKLMDAWIPSFYHIWLFHILMFPYSNLFG